MNLTNLALETEIQSEHNQSGLDMKEQGNTSLARKGEDIMQVRFRVDRLFAIGTRWYFSTREGIDQGPYQSKENANAAITNYIKEFQT